MQPSDLSHSGTSNLYYNSVWVINSFTVLETNIKILPIYLNFYALFDFLMVKKGKGVNLYSASCVHASNALFVTNQSRRLHGHHMQPADTG